MEFWNNGPPHHYSPSLFQYSNIPVFHCSFLSFRWL
jgi:hypothetical protein